MPDLWIWNLGLHNGRPILLGPYADDETARVHGDHAFMGQYKRLPLPTRDRGRATRIIKAQKLDEGATLSDALHRVGHQEPHAGNGHKYIVGEKMVGDKKVPVYHYQGAKKTAVGDISGDEIDITAIEMPYE